MSAIYEPRGAAREYSPLALNLYRGCAHGCRYCYAPACLRMSAAEFRRDPRPRTGILDQLRRDAAKLRGDPREVLLSFAHDPYQPAEAEHGVTRQALEILLDHGLHPRVLTKNPALALSRDGDLLARGSVPLGTTICFEAESQRECWEPGTPALASRWGALALARHRGIPTWVSVEPVIDPVQGLAAIRWAGRVADEIKCGKINHNKELESRHDWPAFALAARAALIETGAAWLLKDSLAELLPTGDTERKGNGECRATATATAPH